MLCYSSAFRFFTSLFCINVPANVFCGAAMFPAGAVNLTGSPLDTECCPELARPAIVLSLHQHEQCNKPTAPRKCRASPILCSWATY